MTLLFQFFGRQIRPGNQHMPRPPMAGGTINPNHPPNALQALPYFRINVNCKYFILSFYSNGWLVNALLFI